MSEARDGKQAIKNKIDTQTEQKVKGGRNKMMQRNIFPHPQKPSILSCAPGEIQYRHDPLQKQNRAKNSKLVSTILY